MKINLNIFLITILTLILLTTGCASNPPAATENTGVISQSKETIKAGDSVKISIYGQDDLSGEFEVDNNGNISLPLIRQVKVIGMTTSEVEAEVTGRLKPDYLINPIVSAELLNQSPIYITGEVRQPGQFPHRTNMTVFTAAALAGGYTYRAKNNVAFIIRAGDKSRTKETVTPETLVYPGDIIEIPERLF